MHSLPWWAELKDSYPWCKLCWKYATEEHTQSAQHQRRLQNALEYRAEDDGSSTGVPAEPSLPPTVPSDSGSPPPEWCEESSPVVLELENRAGKKGKNKIPKSFPLNTRGLAENVGAATSLPVPESSPPPQQQVQRPLHSTSDFARPNVHVLLEPGTVTAPMPTLPLNGQKPTICVMGLHKSGTHCLREYVQRYFSGPEPEPRPRKLKKGKYDTGVLELADGFMLWKHTVPLAPFHAPPTGRNGGPTVVLLTIREPRSWMASLSSHAYELFPTGHQRRRPQGTLWWMFEEICVRTSPTSCEDLFPDSIFPSLPALWTTYARGYLQGDMADSERAGPTFVIVRFEDIVLRPQDVIVALAELGLPRNNTPFTPIDDSASGAAHGRSEVISNLQSRAGPRQFEEQGCSDVMEAQLAPHAEVLELLGYAPWQGLPYSH